MKLIFDHFKGLKKPDRDSSKSRLFRFKPSTIASRLRSFDRENLLFLKEGRRSETPDSEHTVGK